MKSLSVVNMEIDNDKLKIINDAEKTYEEVGIPITVRKHTCALDSKLAIRVLPGGKIIEANKKSMKDILSKMKASKVKQNKEISVEEYIKTLEEYREERKPNDTRKASGDGR